MTAQFMRNTKYANSEFEMQQIPGFTPRHTGLSVSRFECSAHGCIICAIVMLQRIDFED